jgi:hypothetical protein
MRVVLLTNVGDQAQRLSLSVLKVITYPPGHFLLEHLSQMTG